MRRGNEKHVTETFQKDTQFTSGFCTYRLDIQREEREDNEDVAIIITWTNIHTTAKTPSLQNCNINRFITGLTSGLSYYVLKLGKLCIHKEIKNRLNSANAC